MLASQESETNFLIIGALLHSSHYYYMAFTRCLLVSQETGEPLGMIILERCRVDAYDHETRPYTFALSEYIKWSLEFILIVIPGMGNGQSGNGTAWNA